MTDPALPPRIHHLALVADWADWEASTRDDYVISTLGRTLAEEGFIHCSFPQQVQRIADLVYAGRDDVMLFDIETARLTAPVQVESLGGPESFPHIYGPLNRDAVVRATRLVMLDDGRLDVSGALPEL